MSAPPPPGHSRPASARHNHFTRDIKEPGQCPACDAIRAAYARAETEGR